MCPRKRTPTFPGTFQDEPSGLPGSDRELLLQVVLESESRTQTQIDDLKVGLSGLHQRFDEHLENSSRADMQRAISDSSRVPPPKGTAEAKVLGVRVRGSAWVVITMMFFTLAILIMVYLLKG